MMHVLHYHKNPKPQLSGLKNINSAFLSRFEKPTGLSKLSSGLEICKFSLKQSLTAVSFTNSKTGGLLKLFDGFSSQTLKTHRT